MRKVANTAALLGFGICVYTFLLGNGFFRGSFDNDGLAWYFLAKGIFLFTIIYLLGFLVEWANEQKERK